MSYLPDSELSDILANAHRIAVVGLSDRPGSPDYDAASYQQSQGYTVIPVNPRIKESMGFRAVGDVAQADGPVDIIHVFQHNVSLPTLEQSAEQVGAKVIWLENGAEPSGAAGQGSIPVISNRSFQREHQRLLGDKQI